MTQRLSVHQFDPAGGTAGQSPVVSPDGETVIWGDAGDPDAVHNAGGVPVLSVEGETADAPVEGEWRYFPDEDPPELTAADVAVDDSGFTQLAGATAQEVFDNLDASGIGGGSSSTRWEVWVAGNPAEPLLTPDGTDWIYVEVPA